MDNVAVQGQGQSFYNPVIKKIKHITAKLNDHCKQRKRKEKTVNI